MLEEFIDFKKSKKEEKYHVFQSIGYKEFQPYLDDPKEETLKESIFKLNVNTRNYARKQMTWFKSTWASTESPLIPNHLFNFDFKDEKKNQIALEIAISLIEGKKLSEDCLVYKVEKPMFVKDVEFKDYYCEFCDKTLHGENEINIHLKSKLHYCRKRKAKKAKIEALTTQKELEEEQSELIEKIEN